MGVGLGIAAASAITGASSLFGSKGGEKRQQLKYSKYQKPFIKSAQAQIPPYLKIMGGQMPWWMQAYVNMARDEAQRQSATGRQQYLSSLGKMGMGGELGTQDALRRISEARIAPIIQATLQAKLAGLEKAMSMGQQWSMMTPQGSSSQSQPSPWGQAMSGMMPWMGYWMGQPRKENKKPEAKKPIYGYQERA